MSRDDLHFKLRIPEELLNRLKTAASEAHRSATSEIIERLESSFKPSGGVPPIMLERLKKRVAESKYPTTVRDLSLEIIEGWLDQQDQYDEVAKEHYREKMVRDLTDEQFETLLGLIDAANKKPAKKK